MAEAIANPNMTSLGGSSVQDKQDPEYREYRRLWHAAPREFLPLAFPLHLDIEPTNRCNLRCTFCDKLPSLTPDQLGFMDFGLYQRILDESGEHGLYSIKLSYRGESLLHPRLTDMVAYAKRRGVIDIAFNSNGMLLTESKAHELIDVGLDRISISIEGTDPEYYERERRGARFDTVRRNVERLKELRERLGRKFPRIRIQTVALLGLDLAEYARVWAPFCDETASVDYRDVSAPEVVLVDHEWACPNIWQRMAITWDGRIMVCNFNDTEAMQCGQAPGDSVRASWHSELARNTRALHQQGLSHTVKACRACAWRSTEIHKRTAAALAARQSHTKQEGQDD